MTPVTHSSRGLHPALVFAIAFALLMALHAPLLRLPYFWDEAGYYVPAARDLLLTGSLIPRSSVSNAHPPLVMAYLALWWKVAGFAPVVTRTAMLLASSFALLGLFRLAKALTNLEVAVTTTILTALYPVFFAQSSLAHLDLAAAGLTFWGLHAYVSGRGWRSALWFSLASLTKETAILAPLALFAWELLRPWLRGTNEKVGLGRRNSVLLLVPLIPLAAWYIFHYRRTGFVFGNPEFFRYNVEATLQPLRIVLALLVRLWQTAGYFNLLLLTVATLLAMWLPPLREHNGERPRIVLDAQFAMLSVIVAYVLAMAMIGGAELARYMLPVVPLVILICVSTLWRRVRLSWAVVAIVALMFVSGWFINPPYGFAPEDNLAYRDYILLHQHAEEFLEARYPTARVLTAWPASAELTRAYLGYVTRPMRVVRIEHFSAEQLMSAADLHSGDAGSDFEVALVFSTKYEPAHPLLEHWRLWQSWKERFFDYHRDLLPAAAAQILGGNVVYIKTRKGQWIGVIEMQRVVDAKNQALKPQVRARY
ncbi:MAG: glycosyltransferase family 39 protein [Terriglobales bacterium]